MFKQFPSSSTAAYLRHQQSELREAACNTNITLNYCGQINFFLAMKTYLLHIEKTISIMRLLFLKTTCFSCFLSHKAKPLQKASRLPHELWAHHYSRGCSTKTSRTADPRHRHWMPPHLLDWEGKVCVVITALVITHGKVWSCCCPANRGWKHGFCQVHCMRGG